MKKLLLPLLLLGLIFSSCGGNDPVDHGKVSLLPPDMQMTAGQKRTITPTLEGAAQNKSFSWKSSDEKRVSVKKSLSGGTGEVEALKITSEPVKITYYSSDGALSATCSVVVDPLSTILNAVPVMYGKTVAEVKAGIYGFDLIADSETELIYQNKNLNDERTNYVYKLENGKVNEMLLVLKNTEKNRKDAENYLFERYDDLELIINLISFYDVSPDYETGLLAGVFLSDSGLGYDLGVKYMKK